ncbi:MAG: SRPBCC family protein [Thermoplasmata archaeon]|nr:SRPBCC family protein [Thermoplasmata archaeon]
MIDKPEIQDDRELVLSMTLDAPRADVWRCWTEPDLLKRWFAPLPYTTPHAEMDVRPGGASLVVMRSPDGEDITNPGVYLEVVPKERLVITDAFTHAWEPSERPFMTAILTFEDEGPGRTRYPARVRHWTAADREQHEQMGFHDGWTQCARQLEAVARGLGEEQ